MFQSNIPIGEFEFDKLISTFKDEIADIESLVSEKDDSEWDMDAIYYPNHAAIWNAVEAYGKDCRILQKNDFAAIVEFFPNEKTDGIDIAGRIYRLEDLSKKGE